MVLKSFVPLSKTGTVLPRNLKYSLSNSLLDVPLGKLYPEVHGIVLDYVKVRLIFFYPVYQKMLI